MLAFHPEIDRLFVLKFYHILRVGSDYCKLLSSFMFTLLDNVSVLITLRSLISLGGCTDRFVSFVMRRLKFTNLASMLSRAAYTDEAMNTRIATVSSAFYRLCGEVGITVIELEYKR